jgi:hypothetical protein
MPLPSIYSFRNLANPLSLISGLARSFSKRIERGKRVAGYTPPKEGELTSSPLSHTSWEFPYEEVRHEFDRHKVAIEAWDAYLGDSRINAGVDGIADDSTAADNEGRPYQINLDWEGDVPRRIQKAYDKCLEVNEDMGLEGIAPQIIKRMIIEGSAYREIVANFDTNTIVDLKEIPGAKEGYIMRELLNQETEECVGYALYNVKFGSIKKVYAPWQVAEFLWNPFNGVGTSLLLPLLSDFKRIKDTELSMFIARETRAYVKYAYIYEGVSDKQLENLKNLHEQRKQANRRGVETDHFVNKDMKMFDPSNAQLQNIDDITYIEKKILSGVRRPKGFFGGYGEDVNRSVLEKQEEAYIRFMNKVSGMIGSGYKKIFDLQLILMGVSPKEVPLSILWTEKKVDNFLTTASALAIARENGLSRRTMFEELGFDPDLEEDRRNREEPLPMEQATIDKMSAAMNGNGDSDSSKFKAKKNGMAKMTGREQVESIINRIMGTD